MLPSPSPNICTSMWRARVTNFSTNTPASPKLALPCLRTAETQVASSLEVLCMSWNLHTADCSSFELLLPSQPALQGRSGTVRMNRCDCNQPHTKADSECDTCCIGFKLYGTHGPYQHRVCCRACGLELHCTQHRLYVTTLLLQHRRAYAWKDLCTSSAF